MTPNANVRHPIVWTILYLPFGALGGFISVALTFLATKHGLSITEGALLGGAQLLTAWLKWLWAPIVDVTLSPRKWYVLSTAASAVGVLSMSVVPLAPRTLGLLLAVIAIASLVNSVVGMAVEAMIAQATPPEQIGRVSAWFQAGNLGGAGLGGALGLYLVVHLPSPWMAGASMGALFMACCAALWATPPSHAHALAAHEAGRNAGHRGAFGAVLSVVRDLRLMIKTKGGLLAAILCVLPVGTGAAQSVLTQAKVAEAWHAGEHEVALVQGLLAGFVTTIGCFAGGWLCHRLAPRTAYASIGVLLAIIAAAMAGGPRTVTAYVAGNLVYAFGVGLAYAAFTAVVLDAMGKGSGATKYNVYASLANFPIWWLGLLLGFTADKWGAGRMLLAEGAFGIAGVTIFGASVLRVRRSTRLLDEAPA